MASNYLGFPVFIRDAAGVVQSVSDGGIAVASATDVNTGTDKITSTAHPFFDGDMLLYTAGTTAITGLTTGAYYFVVNKATNDFKLSATSGGSAIDLTGTGTGTQTFTPAALVRVRADNTGADVAESPLKTDVNGEIASGSFAAVSVGTKVHFRVENLGGRAKSVAQITT